jgi:hypothetical protein
MCGSVGLRDRDRDREKKERGSARESEREATDIQTDGRRERERDGERETERESRFCSLYVGFGQSESGLCYTPVLNRLGWCFIHLAVIMIFLIKKMRFLKISRIR